MSARADFTIVTLEHLELNSTAHKLFLYLKSALEKAGIKEIKRVEAPSARNLSMADQGKVDALFGDSALTLSSYKNLIKTKLPYFKLELDVVYLKANSKFDPQKIGKYQGVALLNRPEVMDIITKKGLDIFQTPSREQALKMLFDKRVDYAIMPLNMLDDYFAADSRLDSTLAVAKNVLPAVHYYFVLHRRHQRLLPAIERSLAEASRNLSQYPELKSIVIKY